MPGQSTRAGVRDGLGSGSLLGSGFFVNVDLCDLHMFVAHVK